MEKRHWLITAFEPFAGRNENNSKAVTDEIARIQFKKLGDSSWPFTFHFGLLPLEYDRCFEVLTSEIQTLSEKGIHLEGILSIGEGGADFKLETQANNLDDVGEMADNRGVIRADQRIFSDLSEHSPIPLRFPFEAFSRIRTSKNPGFFVCNHLCARMGRATSENSSAPFFGLIHVPKAGSGGIFTPDICAAVIVNGFGNL
jgi:pyrrolidone-carboxylate peptidase